MPASVADALEALCKTIKENSNCEMKWLQRDIQLPESAEKGSNKRTRGVYPNRDRLKLPCHIRVDMSFLDNDN
jgi:hypothetical protein